MPLSAAKVGATAIVAATGTAKTTVWRWQARFMDESVDGLLHEKTRPPGAAPVRAGGRGGGDDAEAAAP